MSDDPETQNDFSYNEKDKDVSLKKLNRTDPYRRILYAIESFKKGAGRLKKSEAVLFDDYLNHGGIDSCKKSTIKKTILDPRTKKSKEIEFAIEEDGKPVNFLFTIHNFFDQRFVKDTGYSEHFYTIASSPVKRFLIYLENKKVCPEYAKDIQESIKLCDQVAIELPLMKELSSNFPDKINKSFSLLYGGTWSAIGNTEAGISLKDKANLDQILGFDLNTAKLVTGFETRGQLKVEKRLILNMYITFIDKETNRISLKEKCEGYSPLKFSIEVDSEIIKYCLKGFYLEGRYVNLSDDTWYLDQILYVSPPFSFMNIPDTCL